MKSIQEIILEGTLGKIRKIDILTIMIVFQMWKEYDLYDEFFEKLSDEELEKYKELDISLDELYNNNSRVKWSFLKKYFDIINKTADYALSCPDDVFSKSDKRTWKEIKTYVSE